MDYYSQLRAMNNAQAAYDGQEAPEYYEDDEFPSWAEGKRGVRCGRRCSESEGAGMSAVGYEYNGFVIPDHMAEGLDLYIERGVNPRQFLAGRPLQRSDGSVRTS